MSSAVDRSLASGFSRNTGTPASMATSSGSPCWCGGTPTYSPLRPRSTRPRTPSTTWAPQSPASASARSRCGSATPTTSTPGRVTSRSTWRLPTKPAPSMPIRTRVWPGSAVVTTSRVPTCEGLNRARPTGGRLGRWGRTPPQHPRSRPSMAVKHPEAVERFRQHVLTEWDAAALYRGLADLSRGRRREVLSELAAIEDKHADFWSEKIREYGAEPPTFGEFSPSRRTLVMLDKARRYSTDLVLPVVEQDERNAIDGYSDEPEAPASMIAVEAEHARALDELMRLGHDGSGDQAADEGPFSEPCTTVLLAGLAGLLAGAFSMAAGEYVSMANQREAYERELAFEREEIEFHPEDERRELELIYEAKGVDADTAAAMAGQVMSDRDVALDTMAREELGLDPDDLGSPWKAALSSFVAFSAGAVLVVLPYLVTGGGAALVAAGLPALVGPVAGGTVMARLNGRPVRRSVLRQVTVGVLAAGATYALGALFGVALE